MVLKVGLLQSSDFVILRERTTTATEKEKKEKEEILESLTEQIKI